MFLVNSYYHESVTSKLNVFSRNSLKKVSQINRCTHRQNLLCGTVDQGRQALICEEPFELRFHGKENTGSSKSLKIFSHILFSKVLVEDIGFEINFFVKINDLFLS